MNTPKIGILDYGIGNLFSVAQAVEACGGKPILSSVVAELTTCDRLILPGVGAFGAGMQRLKEKGLAEPFKEWADKGKPILGICLGMQMLFDSSEEMGEHAGLGLIAGRVVQIPVEIVQGKQRKVPHIGWNTLRPSSQSPSWETTPLRGLTASSAVYFVHSFHPRPKNPTHLLAVADYEGVEVGAVVKKENIVGCQFHPEKSGQVGLLILRNWILEHTL